MSSKNWRKGREEMIMKMRVLCLVILCVSLKTVSSSFCYWNSGCPYKYFSDKTPYNNVRGDIRDSIVKLKGCEPISIWALLSAGKHTPDNFYASLNESLAIRDNAVSSYEHGKSSLCAQDIENLQTWSADNGIHEGNFLTDEGSQELIGIANRLQQAFLRLQNVGENYIIASASDGVTKESAKSFVKGFQKERLNVEEGDENIIAPYKSCNAYQRLLTNPNTYNELGKYKKTADYLATKDRIQRRLGIASKLSDDGIKALYDLCRYISSGIDNKFSPWCALFTTEDLRVLEYISDLENYYKNGYGNTINQHLGRIPLADLLIKFRRAKEAKGKDFVAYFTDTSTLNMVATALGLFKDEIPLSFKRNPKRKWRNSKLSVFSANLVAVLNRCGVNDDADFNVVFYWNEEPLLPICEKGFCSWDEFNNKLLPFLNTSTEFCNE